VVQAILRPDGQSGGGWLMIGGQRVPAALGRGGVRADKQEGDGATPAGSLKLRRVLYRADRVKPPACVVPIEPLAPDDGWCDDPTHRDYNRMIRLPHEARHEELWRSDGLYDVIGVLGWNDHPVERGRGSAIFLHVARPDHAPTEGCVALALVELQRLLAAGLDEIIVLPD
jgi:L,D-peptidoglycan transpeptidase YkuD (ErfK/YbiS/YcfS/YnhG family)